jgi:hypothetical protein
VILLVTVEQESIEKLINDIVVVGVLKGFSIVQHNMVHEDKIRRMIELENNNYEGDYIALVLCFNKETNELESAEVYVGEEGQHKYRQMNIASVFQEGNKIYEYSKHCKDNQQMIFSYDTDCVFLLIKSVLNYIVDVNY